MKKIITCMIFGLLSLISCTEYDEIAIWNKSEIRVWPRSKSCAAG